MPGGESNKSGAGGGLSSWGPTTPAPKTFLRRFRWLIIAGGIVVLLLMLVMLAPTLASMLEQARRDGPGLDNRISPVIEGDHLRQQLGTEAVTVAADPVDLQLFAHHATA